MVVQSEFVAPYSYSSLNLPMMYKDLPRKPTLDQLKQNEGVKNEWIYLKIYIGENSVDVFLLEKLQRVVSLLTNNELISCWFYVRYPYPRHQLRLRFRAQKSESLKHVFGYIGEFLLDDIEWSMESYNPETHRYGTYSIELSEMAFQADSNYNLEILSQGFIKHTQQAYRLAFLSLYTLLIELEISIPKQYELMKMYKKSLLNEYPNRQTIINKLKQNVRDHKNWLDTLSDNVYVGSHGLERFMPALKLRNTHIIDAISRISETNRVKLIQDHIHMSMNRFFVSSQKYHELQIIDMVCKYCERCLKN